MYIVESDFEYKGYRCVTIFTDRGFRCGYVGLPVGHLLYGKDYSDSLDITFKEIKDVYQEKRGVLPWLMACLKDYEDKVTLDFYFNVHGSLTYAGSENNYPIESNLWWLGFDCGHAGDGIDLDRVLELWGTNPRIKQRIEIEKEYPYYEDYPMRDLEYVQQECRNFVDQIIEYVDKIGG